MCVHLIGVDVFKETAEQFVTANKGPWLESKVWINLSKFQRI